MKGIENPLQEAGFKSGNIFRNAEVTANAEINSSIHSSKGGIR